VLSQFDAKDGFLHDASGSAIARHRAARPPHNRSGALALLETIETGLPQGIAGRGSTQDPEVAERFLSDGPQLMTSVDFYFKFKAMECGDARIGSEPTLAL
jgi:hypothetical protein